MTVTKPTTVAEYLDQVPEASREALDQVRTTILAALPGAEEVLSYAILGYRVQGKVVAYASGWAKHVAVYPVPDGDPEFDAAVAAYRSGQSTAKFPLAQPLPLDLIAQQVRLLAGARGIEL